MEEDCECQSRDDRGLAVNAGMREALEGDEVKRQLVQKLESYLRERFDGESASAMRDAMERLLRGVGRDWLVNRGLSPDEALLEDAVSEASARYRSNWDGKVQGEDDRSHNLGRSLGGSVKRYLM